MWTKNRFHFVVLIFTANFPPLYMEAVILPRFFHVAEQQNWNEAQNYCRNHHTNLAKIEEEMVFADCKDPNFCLIGLHRDAQDHSAWKWFQWEKTKFTNWNQTSSQPDDYNGIEDCVVVGEKFWIDVPCDQKFAFLCYDDDVLLVRENKTWEEALEYCRTLDDNLNQRPYTPDLDHPYDLLRMRPNDTAREKMLLQDAQTDEVWMGLRFLAGEWVSVSGKTQQYKLLPACPADEMSCGTIPKSGGLWSLKDCREKKNFLCWKRQ